MALLAQDFDDYSGGLQLDANHFPITILGECPFFLPFQLQIAFQTFPRTVNHHIKIGFLSRWQPKPAIGAGPGLADPEFRPKNSAS